MPDLLVRDVTATEVNMAYVGDITYLPLATGGNLYLATVIDCCSRRVAGWAIADHMRTDLVADALLAAQSCAALWLGPCSKQITEVSTPQESSRNSARIWESPNPWAQSHRLRDRGQSLRITQVRTLRTAPQNRVRVVRPRRPDPARPGTDLPGDHRHRRSTHRTELATQQRRRGPADRA